MLGLGSSLFLRYLHGFGIPSDFAVYQLASQRWFEHSVNPYVQTDSSPFKYSPSFLLCLKFLPAWPVFKALCISLLAASVLLIAPFRRFYEVGLLVIGLALSWKGILEALDYGQVDFFAFFFFVLAARLTHRPLVAGLLLGILPWIKLPWMFLVIPFFSRAFLVGYAAGFFGFGFLLPLGFFGWGRFRWLFGQWMDLVIHQPHELYATEVNQSLWSTGARWMQVSAWGGVLYGIAFLFCLYAGCRLFRRGAQLATVAPWLLLMQLANPLGWRCGSLFCLGIPFSAHNKIPPQRLWFALACFVLQMYPVGVHHWTDLCRFGGITLYWLSLVALCV